MPSEWLTVISTQLFDVHHGLVAYAPVWLSGFAGLVIGTIRRARLATQGLVLVGVGLVTAIGVFPGECWPARFWVQFVPMLSVGLCEIWSLCKRPVVKGVTTLLLAWSLVNTVFFILHPNAFLENRQTGTTYQAIYDQIGGINPALVVPFERPLFEPSSEIIVLGGAGAVFVAFLVVAARRRDALGIVPLVMLLAVLDLMRVKPFEDSEITVISSPASAHIKLATPMRAGFLQFGKNFEVWHTKDNLRAFTVSFGANRRQVPANQVQFLSCGAGSDVISVEAPPDFNVAEQVGFRLKVYQSKSVILRLYERARERC